MFCVFFICSYVLNQELSLNMELSWAGFVDRGGPVLFFYIQLRYSVQHMTC